MQFGAALLQRFTQPEQIDRAAVGLANDTLTRQHADLPTLWDFDLTAPGDEAVESIDQRLAQQRGDQRMPQRRANDVTPAPLLDGLDQVIKEQSALQAGVA